MILALAHRLELSKCDELSLGAELTHWLLHLPRYADADAFVRYPYGVLRDLGDAERLLADLLPGATHAIREAIPGGRFFMAAVDASGGALPPFTGLAPTRMRALVAATVRAFAADLDTATTVAADNANGEGSMRLVVVS